MGNNSTNILLRQSFPQVGLRLPGDFIKVNKEGICFKITSDVLVQKALDKGPGSWEYDLWLPAIKESTFRMIIHGLRHQLNYAKLPWYSKLFKLLKRRYQDGKGKV